jgi:hypothetical protein
MPSDALFVYFQAGVNLLSVKTDEDQTRVRFSAPLGSPWQLETSSSLASQSIWEPVGLPVAGDDYFHDLEDAHMTQAQRFYRLRAVVP